MHWDKHAVAKGLDEVTQCRLNVLTKFKELLDNYHGESRTLAYYDLLASDWLEPFTHIVYSAMQDVLAGNIPKETIPVPVSADLVEAKTRFIDINFHNHLRWAISKLLVSGLLCDWEFERESVVIINSKRDSLFISLIRRLISNYKPDVLVTDPYFKCSKFEWLIAIWNWRRWLAWDNIAYPIHISSQLDYKWRKAQAAITKPVTNLNELVLVLMPLHLPVALLEGFVEYRKAVLSFPVVRPKVVFSANALHFHLAWKLLVAEWRQQGTFLTYHQHGGGYGVDYIHPIEEFEKRVADRYYTFGWGLDKQHIRSLSPPQINAPTRPRKRLLLCCICMPGVVNRLHFGAMPGTIETMHNETCEFLARLPDHSHLLVRPYPIDYGWEIVEMMRKAAPNAEFDHHKKSVRIHFAESRLVIHNYLGTGWLETLALDIPTVCFYETETFVFREAVQPHILALETIGVLHRSGNSAALFVASLADDIEKWWNEAETQEARRNFVEQYANFSPDWKEQWEKEFKEVLDTIRN